MTHSALAVSLLTASLAAAGESSVNLSLERYDELTKAVAQKSAADVDDSLAVIDSVRLEGAAQRNLTLVVKGRSFGKRPAPVKLMRRPDARLGDCGPDAVLSLSDGVVMLKALRPAFTLRCTLGASKDHSLHLAFLDVLDVSGAVSDASVETSEGSDGARLLSLTAKKVEVEVEAPPPPPVVVLPPTASGRYRLSLMPEEVRFQWKVAFHNANAAPTPAMLQLRDNEAVSQVTTTAQWESVPGGLKVMLPPGDHEVEVTGSMKSAEFVAPVDSAVQYVLLETHPLLRPDIATDAQRISQGQTGLVAQYQGAQAFLVSSGQTLKWTTSRLETLPTDQYAVSSLESIFFVGGDGTLLAESSVSLQNQGAPELSLPLGAMPTFASNGGVPAVLTNDTKGNLLLPLSPGEQKLMVQHKKTLERAFGTTSGTLALPGTGATASNAVVELRFGREWVPVFASFAGERFFGGPTLAQCFEVAALAAWAALVLTFIGLRTVRKLLLATLVAVVMSVLQLQGVLVAVLGAGTMLRALVWMKGLPLRSMLPKVSSLGGVVTATAVAGVLSLGVVVLFGDNMRRLFGMSADALAGEAQVAYADSTSPNLTKKSMRNFSQHTSYGEPTTTAKSPGQDAVLYRGLPARTALPEGTRVVGFSKQLYDARTVTSASVFAVSTAWVSAAEALLALALLALLFFSRQQLLGGLKQTVESLVVRAPPATEPEPAVTA